MESPLHPSIAATGFLGRMALSYRAGLFIVLLVAFATHLPTSFGRFSTDDYLIQAMTVGDADLLQRGFTKADPDKPLWRSLLDGFHFYSPAAGTLENYRHYGNLPWWTADEATMNPLRPLAAVTHWLDYRLFPRAFGWHAFHSLIYVLLFAWSGYRLFWRLSPGPSVAVLASLMLVVDFSHVLNFNWIAARNVFMAGALGCAVLERFLAWRESGSGAALGMSLLLFGLALLTAEASIALGGYLLAYLLLVERRGWRPLMQALLPYALLVLVWRGAYNALGYGAYGIGLYVDPGRSPLEFLTSALQTFPLLLGSVLTSVDNSSSMLSPTLRPWAALVSALLVLVALVLALPLLRGSSRARFMLVGSVLAAVPACALISAGSRSSLFVGPGFFWVLALWLHWLVRDGRRPQRILLGLLLCLHLFFPAFAGFANTSQLLPVAYPGDEQYESVARPLQAAGGHKTLVIVNAPAPNRLFYLPFEWRQQYGLVPDRLNVLAPGLVSFNLLRRSDRVFELVAPAGLPLDHIRDIKGLDGQHPGSSAAYAHQLLQGLLTSPDTVLSPGVQRRAGDLHIQVLEQVEGRPSRLRIEFIGQVRPDDMLWQEFDWKTREYRLLPVPAIGEKRAFTGPFDTRAEPVVKLCLNCEN